MLQLNRIENEDAIAGVHFPLYFCTYFLSLSVHIFFQTKYIRLFPSSLCTNNSLSLRAKFLSFCTVHSSFLSFYTFPFSLSKIFISFLCLNFLSLSVHSLPFFSQGWEFALSLFALLLLSLFTKRAKWADGSFHFF